MSTNEIQRIQDDLATMRQAVLKDKPYDRADILPAIAIAAGALIAIPMLQSQMFHNPRVCILVGLTPGLFLWCRRYFQTKNQQATRPVIWTEYKWSLVAMAVLIPASVGWMWWSQQFGSSREAAGAAVIFCMGIAGCMIGVIDGSRRTYLPSGISVMIFALVLPTLDPKQIPIVGCVFLAAFGAGMAAIIWWRTRGDSTDGVASKVVE